MVFPFMGHTGRAGKGNHGWTEVAITPQVNGAAHMLAGDHFVLSEHGLVSSGGRAADANVGAAIRDIA